MNVMILLGVGINILIIVFYMLKEVMMKIRHYLHKKAKKKLSTKILMSSTKSQFTKKVKIELYAKNIVKNVSKKNTASCINP